jgi:hypothetical protein
MEGTVLLILGGSGGDVLARVLQEAGLACHTARGPLRVWAVLEQGPVDLVLWAEEARNAALGEDLRREWERHPHLPVVHLFAHPCGAAAPTSISPQVVDSLPVADHVTLLRVLSGILGALPAARGGVPPERNDLAFRRVLSHLRATRSGEIAREPAADVEEELHPQVTSLSAHERSFLFSAAGNAPPDQPSLPLRSWRRLRGMFFPAHPGKGGKS